VSQSRTIVVGGGIIGTTAAALLAEGGTDVTLIEQTAVAAGASGRNSGTIQHPFDPVLLELHRETLDRYRELAALDAGFAFPDQPAGVLLLTDDLAAAGERAGELMSAYPELRAEVLDAAAVGALEPSLAAGWAAIRVATGYPVVPEAATRMMAARAVRAGAAVRIGIEARPWLEDGRVRGVALGDGETIPGSRVLVAAGPWTPEVLDLEPAWPPISRTFGVTVQVSLPDGPRSILEEGVVHTINTPSGHADSLFSLVTADGVATVGSTFFAEQPDPEALAPVLLERGSVFVPGLAHAEIREVRLCARPQSVDGRPFIGPVPGADGLFVCAGHGPWGMSTGPASAAMAVDLMTGREDRIPAALRADRAWAGAQ
jgi:glycine/D-amino acid oxidase-like deaminating enzyme